MTPMTSKKFETSIVNLQQLQQFKFVIPTYQRPYVWGDEQIDKFLSDFYKSYQLDYTADYFIGTILTKENGETAELIDGQQRFTTLWLTAFVFAQKNAGTNLEKFLKDNDNALKLTFEIRSEVGDYFKMLLEKDKSGLIRVIGTETIEKFPYLKNIAEALVKIKDLIDKVDEIDLKGFGDYIYEKVYFIKNATPEKIDLNKLFSTINSAGVQLEQTDIIKANLLKLIDEKVMFGKIWEVCENMNNFFERNVRDSFPGFSFSNVNLSNLVPFSKAVFDPNSEDVSSGDNPVFSINQLHGIAAQDYSKYVNKEVSEASRSSEDLYCRSIINFGQLLLHTYRLHLNEEKLPDFKGTFHVNRLIEIFSSLQERNDPNEIKRFFLLLWKVRFLFDKYVIKWITDGDTKAEHLELMNISKIPEQYYSRSKFEKCEMLMLQSVLYFTGDYSRQYWLTPYLSYLMKSHANLGGNEKIHLRVLKILIISSHLIRNPLIKLPRLNLLVKG